MPRSQFIIVTAIAVALIVGVLVYKEQSKTKAAFRTTCEGLVGTKDFRAAEELRDAGGQMRSQTSVRFVAIHEDPASVARAEYVSCTVALANGQVTSADVGIWADPKGF